jgi:hypothetical protein
MLIRGFGAKPVRRKKERVIVGAAAFSHGQFTIRVDCRSSGGNREPKQLFERVSRSCGNALVERREQKGRSRQLRVEGTAHRLAFG